MNFSYKKLVGVIIIITAIVGLGLFWSYEKESGKFNQAICELTSAENKLSRVMGFDNYIENISEARILLSTAKTDLEEGIDLLEETNIESTRKRAILKMAKTYRFLLRFGENYIEAYLHYQLAQQSSNVLDWSIMEKEFSKSKKYVIKSHQNFLRAKQMWSGIDTERLPHDLKAIVSDQDSRFEEYKDFLPVFVECIDGFISFSEVFEDLMVGAEYLEKESFVEAESAFRESKDHLQTAKDIFGELRSSEVPTFASRSIFIYSKIRTLETVIDHYIQGCVYMQEGKISLALTEFEKAQEKMEIN